MKNIPYIILSLAVPFCILASSCQNEEPLQPEITAGVSYNPTTKIYPNKTFEFVPEVDADKAENFAIQSVFFGETQCKENYFTINSATGVVTATIPSEIALGDYLVSITCELDGQKFILRNALTLTAIPGIPDVNIDESPKTLRYESLQQESTAALPFVSVLVVNESAPLTGIEIRNIRKGDDPVEGGEELFTVDSKALTITPLRSDSWTLGTYTADLKINTESFSAESEEGLLEDALVFNVEALPVLLTYPEAGNFYQNQAKTYAASFEDAVPTDIAIKSVTVDGTPLADWSNLLSIDAEANISVAAVADAKVGEYKISVSYKYAGQDLSTDDALCVRCIAGLPELLTADPDSKYFEPAELAEGSAETFDGFKIIAAGESAEILSYSIASAKRDGTVFDHSGKLTLSANGEETPVWICNLVKGTWEEGEYSIDIRCVTASFDENYENGVFNSVVNFSIHEKVELAYDDAFFKAHTGWKVNPSAVMPSGTTYSFKNPAADYASVITIDQSNGALSAVKGNKLPEGSYDVEIVANIPEQEPTTGTLHLVLTNNPYYFTYFYYGNNLGLTKDQVNCASQYRVKTEAELLAMSIEVQESDINSQAGAVYTLFSQHTTTKATVDASTGALSFAANSTAGQPMGVVLVQCTTTDPEDALNTWTVIAPLAIDFSADATINVRYQPFFYRINPKVGGRTEVPQFTGSVDEAVFDMDFRRNFYYYNINGKGSDGEEFVSGKLENKTVTLLTHIWDAFTDATGLNYKSGTTTANYGGKIPMSYYNGKTDSNKVNLKKSAEQLSLSPAYVVPGEWYVKVNPNLWKYNGGWADGVFFGEITYTNVSSTAVNNGTAINPIAIWLDPNFE